MALDHPEKCHQRYLLQANWSRSFREYLYRKLTVKRPARILEVGCGTGAVLDRVRNEYKGDIGLLCGIDLDRDIEKFADTKMTDQLLEGSAEKLPFSNGSFDFVFCHFLLLWVKDPVPVVREMKRVTAVNGICAALAEPCYDEMKAVPETLYELACRQRRALALKGADVGIGCRLGEIFHSAGFTETEWGSYKRYSISPAELQTEVAQMKEDTGCFDFALDPAEIETYEVPTYFAFSMKR